VTYVSDRVIDLQNAKVTVDENSLSAFKIITPSTATEFFAENDSERDKWVSQLRKAIDAAVRAKEDANLNFSDDDEQRATPTKGLLVDEATQCAMCEQLFSQTLKRYNSTSTTPFFVFSI